MSEWSLNISRCENGSLLIKESDEKLDHYVIQETDGDDLKAGEELLWAVMEYFDFRESKHNFKRLTIVRGKK